MTWCSWPELLSTDVTHYVATILKITFKVISDVIVDVTYDRFSRAPQWALVVLVGSGRESVHVEIVRDYVCLICIINELSLLKFEIEVYREDSWTVFYEKRFLPLPYQKCRSKGNTSFLKNVREMIFPFN